MHAKRLSLGALEAAVLNVLWDRGPSTVAEVVASLPPGGERHHNTCATVLTRLVRRKLVARASGGRGHRYRALVTREDLGRTVLDSVRRDLFGGSLRGLVAQPASRLVVAGSGAPGAAGGRTGERSHRARPRGRGVHRPHDADRAGGDRPARA